MIFLKIILWLLIIPYILGKFLEDKDENSIFYPWVLGNVIEMGICLILAVPMIIFKVKFFTLLEVYNIVIYFLTVISIIINRKKIVPKIKKKPKFTFWKCFAILLVIALMFVKFLYSNVNNDDSTFVVTATKAIENGYMYCDGPNGELFLRRALAPISIFFAIIAQNLGIHVTIVMHTIAPIIWIAIGGIVFYRFGKFLFKDTIENKDEPYIFLIFMMLLFAHFFTVKGVGAYYLKFTWFGRALLGAVLLPLIWKTMLEIEEGKNTFKNWMIVLFTVLASCLASEMAIALTSISVMALALIVAIRNKKFLYIVKSMICVSACGILAILYLVL